MPTRDETKAWTRAVLAHLGLKPTEAARKISRAPSTLNRFLNDPDAEHDLSRDTVERLAELAGVAPYEMPEAAPRRQPGIAEAEAVAYQANELDLDDKTDGAIRQFVGMRNGVDPWVLRSEALTCVGYLPGDVLLVDLNERARPHDVVCAQVYDWARAKAQTVFRLYEPPYLLASSTDRTVVRPLVVDDDAVLIKGVVTLSLRPRRTGGFPG